MLENEVYELSKQLQVMCDAHALLVTGAQMGVQKHALFSSSFGPRLMQIQHISFTYIPIKFQLYLTAV